VATVGNVHEPTAYTGSNLGGVARRGVEVERRWITVVIWDRIDGLLLHVEPAREGLQKQSK